MAYKAEVKTAIEQYVGQEWSRGNEPEIRWSKYSSAQPYRRKLSTMFSRKDSHCQGQQKTDVQKKERTLGQMLA